MSTFIIVRTAIYIALFLLFAFGFAFWVANVIKQADIDAGEHEKD